MLEFLDVFLLCVGIFTLYIASSRLNMIKAAESFKTSFQDVSPIGISEESVSFKIRREPLFISPWKRGRLSSINEKPILLVIVFILAISVIFEVIILSLTYTKFGVLVCYMVIVVAFHNGPDDINIDEYYLRKIIRRDSATLNGHDVLFIEKAVDSFKSWSQVQALFGLGFMLSILFPTWLSLIGFLLLVAPAFLYLGYKYSIDRAIFK